MTEHLIACVLGGGAPRARTELHDVAFAVGASLQAVHGQLLNSWFGDPHGLHVDAWCFLDSVKGYRVHLARTPPDNGLHLYFINIGGYRPGVFAEHHAWGFFAGKNKAGAKARAKQMLLQDHEQTHKDDLYDIDDCLQIGHIGEWHVHLTPDASTSDPHIVNGYFPLPKPVIDDWIARRGND
ncbi:MAG TPA: DUF1543 domain-containing protein [Rhodanobacteraceae bacterium]|nr:DUF1543 domain-containing protein [Rhodanobacteraceae bacterium]